MTTEPAESSAQPEGAEQSAPTLSVTVLNYNYAHYLSQCLDSILRQTWTDFELILINDCSTDNSLDVIQPYLQDSRVRLVNHTTNRGYIASLLEGSRMSRGRYITVISADDYCVSDRAFESLLRPMEADFEVAFAYCAFGEYRDDGTRTWLLRPHDSSFVRPGAEEYRDLVVANYAMHSGLIIRATAYAAVGGYDASARYACDTIMWLILCGQGKVAYCADELYAHRRHGSNMSNSTSGVLPSLREHIYGIKHSYAVMRRFPGVTRNIYEHAMRRNLSFPAMERIFAGQRRSAWYAFWCAVRVDPLRAVLQNQTLSLIACTLVGPRGYQVVRLFFRREYRSIAAA